MRNQRYSVTFAALLLFLTSLAEAQLVTPPNDTVLHVFGSEDDGIAPVGGVIFDNAGNLYGVTEGGGGTSGCFTYNSCGTVYELSPPTNSGGAWTETILYRFTGTPNDGELPSGGLISDASGNLYGVISYGGTGNCRVLGSLTGCGTAFELSPPSQPGGTWTETVLYSFQSGNDGYAPVGTLAVDENGNLYGATYYGGGFGSCNAPFYQYCGTIFELSPPAQKAGQWSEQILYSFKGDSEYDTTDGANPNGGLIFDSQGTLYGTTSFGGHAEGCKEDAGRGCGTVFKVQRADPPSQAWVESVLYQFLASPDGAAPAPGLVVDQEGSLYGATAEGGSNEDGTIFELSAPVNGGLPWKETILWNFDDSTGWQPEAGLTAKNNTLYGTTSIGGPFRAGSVFQLSWDTRQSQVSWDTRQSQGRGSALSVLSVFPVGNQAAGPGATLIFGKDGNLYGTTQVYDHEIRGAVFKIAP